MAGEHGVKQRGQDERPRVTETIGIDRARDILGKLALRAGYGRERIILAYGPGKQEIAAVIGLDDLERLLAAEATPEAA